MTHSFAEYVKPHLGEMLAAVGLDVEYTRAEGNTLYYQDSTGHEVPVLDMLGGYGSLLFGHNHHRLIDRVRQVLDSQIPIHAQFSLRGQAGKVGQALNTILRRETSGDEPYLVTFASTGAEAVEAALKHAELDRILKLVDLLDKITFNIDIVRTALARGEVRIASDIYEFADIREHVFDVRNFEELVVGLINHNSIQLTKRPVFLALEHSFHGKLAGSVQLTYNKNFRRPFQYFGLKTRFVPIDQPEVLERIVHDEQSVLFDLAIQDGQVVLIEHNLPIFTAFIIEPIQGEGGIHVVSREFGESIRKMCNQIDCPLIVDEIQSGMGRVGALFASSLIGLRGDYYTLSKSLGGGIAKISAMLIRKSLYRKEFGLIHSSTFADDDFSCAIALEVLAMLEDEDGRAYRLATERGARLLGMLNRLRLRYPDVIRDVRGKGLFIGIEFQPQDNAESQIIRSGAYTDSLGYVLSGYLLRTEGIRVVPTGSAPNVLRLEPSIYITDDEIDRLDVALDRVCRILQNQDALHLVYPLTERRESIPRHDIRNFRGVLGAIPQSAERPTTRPIRKVAFINHLISPEWLRQVDPSLAELGDSALREFVARMDPMKRSAPYPPVRIYSPLGSAVDFILYPLCVSSAQMGHYLTTGDLNSIRRDIDERIRTAKNDGCEVAGLGMYTSIVTNNCTSLHIPEIGLTSGNALTVAMGIEAMEKAASERTHTLEEACMVVVGAAGNIASTYCALFAERLPRLILVGSHRTGSLRRLRNTVYDIYQECWMQIAVGGPLTGIPARLANEPLIRGWLAEGRTAAAESGRVIAEELERRYGEDPFLVITNDLSEVRRGHLVLCAANSPEPFLGAEHFRDDAIVCDIAVPNNVVPGIRTVRPDLSYLQGGIVATPNHESLHPGARAFLGEGQMFACMAETAVLGLAGLTGHYSYGAISRRQVREIAALASIHGFHLADYKRSHSL